MQWAHDWYTIRVQWAVYNGLATGVPLAGGRTVGIRLCTTAHGGEPGGCSNSAGYSDDKFCAFRARFAACEALHMGTEQMSCAPIPSCMCATHGYGRRTSAARHCRSLPPAFHGHKGPVTWPLPAEQHPVAWLGRYGHVWGWEVVPVLPVLHTRGSRGPGCIGGGCARLMWTFVPPHSAVHSVWGCRMLRKMGSVVFV